jgi:hypothetical protein
VVLADSHGISRAPCYLGTSPRAHRILPTGLLPPAAPLSSGIRLSNEFVTRSTGSTSRQASPTTPARQRRRPLTPHWFGLIPFRSPLLRESLLLSFPRGTEMFQFPRFPLPALCVQTGMTGHDPSLVSQFGHPRINACLSTSRGLSQTATSFIGS